MEDSESEEEKMDKKKRRRIKKPEPDSSDEDGEPFTTPKKISISFNLLSFHIWCSFIVCHNL